MTDEELIARLRELSSFENGVGVMQDFYCGEEMLAAADRIEALVKADRAQVEVAEKQAETIIRINARAERLEAAASSVADDVCSYICPSVGRAGEPILHDPRCIALRAALKGDDHV